MANGMIKMACWFMVGTILMISLLLQPVANAEPGTRGLNPPPGSIVATIYIDADASPQRNLTLAKYNITPLVEYYSSVLAYANDTQITAMNRDGIWAGEDISRFWVNRSSWVNFDTRNGEPAMPADLRIDHYEPNTEGLYIIQLIGPPYQEWINTLKGNGVQIYWSVPPDNYIVRMNSNIEGTVRNLWFVQWVGIYQPAYKIEPNITTPKIVVQVWNGSTSNETIKALRSLGTVEDVSYASSDDEYEVRMLFDNSNLTAIANLPDVMLIAEFNYNITALNNSNNVPHPLDIGVAVVLIVITMIFSYGFIRHSKRKRDKKMVNEDQISQKEAEK